jgi:hypothetical protein
MKQLIYSFFTYIWASLLFGGCSRKTLDLELALSMAGANRPELEKVLAHYSADAADSLKYRAACFLIENMIYHYEACSIFIRNLVMPFNNLFNYKSMRIFFTIMFGAMIVSSCNNSGSVVNDKIGQYTNKCTLVFKGVKEFPLDDETSYLSQYVQLYDSV